LHNVCCIIQHFFLGKILAETKLNRYKIQQCSTISIGGASVNDALAGSSRKFALCTRF